MSVIYLKPVPTNYSVWWEAATLFPFSEPLPLNYRHVKAVKPMNTHIPDQVTYISSDWARWATSSAEEAFSNSDSEDDHRFFRQAARDWQQRYDEAVRNVNKRGLPVAVVSAAGAAVLTWLSGAQDAGMVFIFFITAFSLILLLGMFVFYLRFGVLQIPQTWMVEVGAHLGRVKAAVNAWPLTPGQAFGFRFEQEVLRDVTLKGGTVEMLLIEAVYYWQGSDTMFDKALSAPYAVQSVPAQALEAGHPLRVDARFTLPIDAPHSLAAVHNHLGHLIRITLQFDDPDLPDYVEVFQVQVVG